MPGLGKTKQTSAGGRSDGLIRPKRTEELQCLYDRWQDSECYEESESPSQPDEDQEHQHSPDGRASTRRSSSPWSYGTISSGGSSYLVRKAREDYEPSNKPRRRGPLSKPKRERTAFMRRLGACPPCRDRKVRCKHWDLSQFETSYLTSRHGIPPSPVDMGDGKDVQRTGTPVNGADLLGLEDVNGSAPSHPEAASNSVDLVPALETGAIGCPGLESMTPDPPIGPDSPDIWDAGLVFTLPMQTMAVGKEVFTSLAHSEWRCQFSNHATSPNDMLADKCCMRYSTLFDLMEHFWRAHHLFQLPKFWFKCGGCAKWNDEAWFCAQCGLVESWGQEQWIFGNAVGSPLLNSV